MNAAGSYCDVVASWTGHIVPIANMLHHYVITEPLRELIDLAPELPVVRDPYSHCLSARGDATASWSAPMRPRPRMFAGTASRRAGISKASLSPPELDRLTPWLEKAAERFPLFGRAGIKSVVSGAITHTPDGVYLSGPAPGPRNYWMHCGASIGICQGAGAGKYLAQWMVHGQAEINMREFDPRRFGDWATEGLHREGRRSPTTITCTIATSLPSSTRSAAICANPRCTTSSKAEGRAILPSLRLGARALVRREAVEREAFSFRRSNWWDAGARGSARGARTRRA